LLLACLFLSVSFLNQEKLLSAVRKYTIFLYVGFVFTTLAPRVAVKAAPAAVASTQRFLAAGYDLTVTVAFFATATLLLQALLARVLKPSTRARMTPLAAWPLAAVTWCCITSFFVNCLTFGDENVGGYGEWAAAAGASVANLDMSARTVRVSRRFSWPSVHSLDMVSRFLISSVTSLEDVEEEDASPGEQSTCRGACLQAAVSSFIYHVLLFSKCYCVRSSQAARSYKWPCQWPCGAFACLL
jgi:hypothetical protein